MKRFKDVLKSTTETTGKMIGEHVCVDVMKAGAASCGIHFSFPSLLNTAQTSGSYVYAVAQSTVSISSSNPWMQGVLAAAVGAGLIGSYAALRMMETTTAEELEKAENDLMDRTEKGEPSSGPKVESKKDE